MSGVASMSSLKDVKFTVYPSRSSDRSVTGPNSPPCVALSLETFGISVASFDWLSRKLDAERPRVMRHLTHLLDCPAAAFSPGRRYPALGWRGRAKSSWL